MRCCPRPTCKSWFHINCLGPSRPREAEDALQYLLARPISPSDPRSADHSQHALESLPRALVRMASLPIVRGTPTEGIEIVGNGQIVLEARRMVHDVISQDLPLDKEWKVKCGLVGSDDGEGQVKSEESELDDDLNDGECPWGVEGKEVYLCGCGELI